MIPKTIEEKDFRYNELPHEYEVEFYKEFMKLLAEFALTIDFESELEVNIPVISYICKRVDQRKDYYLYFHSTEEHIMHMSHEKELALLAYWVNKYKPIRFKEQIHERRFFMENGTPVSDAFSVYIIISAVCANDKSKACYFTKERVMNLYYDMTNRDFSKEAIISRIEDLIA